MCEELEKIGSKLKIQDDINEEVNLLLNKMTDTIEQLSEENDRLVKLTNAISNVLLKQQEDINSLFENKDLDEERRNKLTTILMQQSAQIKCLDENYKELKEKKEESENVFFNVYTCTL